jgi:hypothetical protein
MADMLDESLDYSIKPTTGESVDEKTEKELADGDTI